MLRDFTKKFKNKLLEMENLFIKNAYHIEKSSDSENCLYIEGYCSHFNQMNLNQQVVDKKSFDYFFSLYNEQKLKPRLNYEHTNDVIGGIDSLETDDTGIYMVAHINKALPLTRDMIIPNILAGDISSFSTEGFIKDGYAGIVELENGYYVKNFVLTGVSVVSTPADWDAMFSVSNFIKGYEEWKKEEEKKHRKVYLLL